MAEAHGAQVFAPAEGIQAPLPMNPNLQAGLIEGAHQGAQMWNFPPWSWHLLGQHGWPGVQAPHTAAPEETRPRLPPDADLHRSPAQDLVDFIMQADLRNVDPGFAGTLAQHLAVFGVSTKAAFLSCNADECINTLQSYEGLECPPELQGLRAKSTVRVLLASKTERPQPAPAANASDSQLASALTKLSKPVRGKRRDKEKHQDALSSSEDEAHFDFPTALALAGLAGWPTRPEVVSQTRMNRVHKAAMRSFDRHVPFLADSSAEALKSWSPQPSAAYGADPSNSPMSKRKAFTSVAHLLRHRLTWGLLHVALGAFDLTALLNYSLELLELGDAYGLQFVVAYDAAKMSKILQDIAWIGDASKGSSAGVSDPNAPVPSFASTVEAKNWLSKQLKTPDRQLIQDTRLSMVAPAFDSQVRDGPRTVHTGRRLDDNSPPGTSKRARHYEAQPAKGKGKGPGRLATQVCFQHDPSSGKTCPHIQSCPRVHLDTTTSEEKSRYDRALAAFNAKARPE